MVWVQLSLGVRKYPATAARISARYQRQARMFMPASSSSPHHAKGGRDPIVMSGQQERLASVVLAGSGRTESNCLARGERSRHGSLLAGLRNCRGRLLLLEPVDEVVGGDGSADVVALDRVAAERVQLL